MANSEEGSKEDGLAKLPVGYRFVPTDEELMAFYLRKKILSQPLRVTSIQDIDWKDFYREPPSNLVTSSSSKDREWFFFIRRDNNLQETTSRTIGNGLGLWKKSNNDEVLIPIRDDSNFRATKNYFTYFTGREDSKVRKTHWEMEEYRSHFQGTTEQRNHTIEDEWVLVRIKRGGYYKS